MDVEIAPPGRPGAWTPINNIYLITMTRCWQACEHRITDTQRTRAPRAWRRTHGSLYENPVIPHHGPSKNLSRTAWGDTLSHQLPLLMSVSLQCLSLSISLSCSISNELFMAALRSRCGHYISVLHGFFLSFLFYSSPISAVTDWISTILPHITWP